MYCLPDKKVYKLNKLVSSAGCEVDNLYGIPTKTQSKSLIGDILFRGEKRGIEVLIIRVDHSSSNSFEVGDIPVVEIYKNKKKQYIELTAVTKVNISGNLNRLEC